MGRSCSRRLCGIGCRSKPEGHIQHRRGRHRQSHRTRHPRTDDQTRRRLTGHGRTRSPLGWRPLVPPPVSSQGCRVLRRRFQLHRNCRRCRCSTHLDRQKRPRWRSAHREQSRRSIRRWPHHLGRPSCLPRTLLPPRCLPWRQFRRRHLRSRFGRRPMALNRQSRPGLGQKLHRRNRAAKHKWRSSGMRLLLAEYWSFCCPCTLARGVPTGPAGIHAFAWVRLTALSWVPAKHGTGVAVSSCGRLSARHDRPPLRGLSPSGISAGPWLRTDGYSGRWYCPCPWRSI